MYISDLDAFEMGSIFDACDASVHNYVTTNFRHLQSENVIYLLELVSIL